MQSSTPSVDDILIQEEHIENANNSVYFESSVRNINKDIEIGIVLGLSSFGRLRKSIQSNKNILIKLKIQFYRSLILLIATYASETWALTVASKKKLIVLEM